jgi:hypothetical protein
MARPGRLPDGKPAATRADHIARTTSQREVHQMHSPHSTFLVAQQHIADLHRAADRNRLVHTATTSSNDVPAPRHAAAAAPVSFLHWLRRRLA